MRASTGRKRSMLSAPEDCKPGEARCEPAASKRAILRWCARRTANGSSSPPRRRSCPKTRTQRRTSTNTTSPRRRTAAHAALARQGRRRRRPDPGRRRRSPRRRQRRLRRVARLLRRNGRAHRRSQLVRSKATPGGGEPLWRRHGKRRIEVRGEAFHERIRKLWSRDVWRCRAVDRPGILCGRSGLRLRAEHARRRATSCSAPSPSSTERT